MTKHLTKIEKVLNENQSVSYTWADKVYTVVLEDDDKITFTEELFDDIEQHHNLSAGEVVLDALKWIKEDRDKNIDITTEVQCHE